MTSASKYCAEYMRRNGASVEIAHSQQWRFVNLEITSACNLRCFACNQYCDSAPTGARMTVDQVRRFVRESSALGWPWEEIIIMGGEPTTHPNLFEILTAVREVRDYRPSVNLKLVSNGHGKRATAGVEIAASMGYDVRVGSFFADKKAGELIKVPEFGNVFLAPVDLGHKRIKSCQIHSTCGLALTRWGYLPCACGGARVIGLDVFRRRLNMLDRPWAESVLKRLCGFCGRNLNYCQKVQDNDSVSPFWNWALARYRKDGPFDFPLYGAS